MGKIADLIGDKVVNRQPRKTFVDRVAEAATANPFGVTLAAIDFEYNNTEVVCCHVVIRQPDGQDDEVGFDLREGQAGVADFKALVAYLIGVEAVFVGHAIRIAEIPAMLRLGIDLRQSRWIDTFTEASMLAAHPYISFQTYGLLGCLTTVGIPVAEGAKAHKDAMRNLIIAGGPYSDADMASILEYCAEDTRHLPDLLSRLVAIHSLTGSPTDVAFFVQRGSYLLHSALLNWNTKGLPVDVEWWADVMRYRVAIRDIVCRASNAFYLKELGVEFFGPKGPKKKVRVDENLGFKTAAFGRWLADNPDIEWAKTMSGLPRLDRDYLDEGIRRVPILARLKQDKDTLQALNSARVEPNEDGYVECGSRTFHTVTGRNQPMVKEGFIFNMAPLFRVAGTKPKPGWALIAADWSKQEPAIAISLSRDDAYRAVYDEADLYLAGAIRAGAAPSDATKKSHAIVRQAFKAAMLGIGYGMGQDTLSKKIYAEVNLGADVELMSMGEAQAKAADILSWHKTTFHRMWTYLHARAGQAHKDRWIAAEDGWLTFINRFTKPTQLINFPIQANGAAMLRQAIITLSSETDLDIPFTLHDAVYANCRIEDIEKTKAILSEHMKRAADAILADNPIPIVVDFKIVTEDQPLEDDRANVLLPLVQKCVAELRQREAERAKEMEAINAMVRWAA